MEVLLFLSLLPFSQCVVVTNGFEVIDKSQSGKDEGKVVLCAATLQEKNLWVKEIRASIKEYQKHVFLSFFIFLWVGSKMLV